jgi:Flp pilus assembly protein TadG
MRNGMTLGLACALLVARARRPIRKLLRDKRGVSAVEFALLLPLMVTLYLGGAEVSQAVAIDRKVTLISRTLADLVAQATTVTNDDMTKILGATAAVMAPYPDSTLKIIVSSVTIDNSGIAKIAWSDTKGGTPRVVGTTVTLPPALVVNNSSLIWAEAQYNYTPAIGYVIVGTKSLSDQIYMRPRLSDKVARTP